MSMKALPNIAYDPEKYNSIKFLAAPCKEQSNNSDKKSSTTNSFRIISYKVFSPKIRSLNDANCSSSEEIKKTAEKCLVFA